MTYNYYQQLNGYKYLKNLVLGYHFYHGSYIEHINEVLDTTKKTIIHIPSVNSRASSGNKYEEVDQIMRCIGEEVEIKLYKAIEKRKDFKGILKSFDADTVTIDEEGNEISFNRKDIAIIRLAFDF